MQEIWEQIKGYEDSYEVSDLGRVRSTKRNKTIILKPQKHCRKYYSVGLYKNGNNKNYLIHRLVYENFVGDVPTNLTIDHIDGDHFNNRLNNLQLLTNRENVSKYYAGTKKTSRFTGVCWHRNRWQADIRKGNKKIRLGRFITESQAALAYQKAKISWSLF